MPKNPSTRSPSGHILCYNLNISIAAKFSTDLKLDLNPSGILSGRSHDHYLDERTYILVASLLVSSTLH
jgi:hypothetical protein